jgi:hypothetical protein
MTSNDQQNLFESYLKINEDLGLGPKQDGTGTMKMPTIGQTSGANTVRPNMDPAKSSITHGSEEEEDVSDLKSDIETLKKALDKVSSTITDDISAEKHDQIKSELFSIAESVDRLLGEVEESE